MGKVFKVEIAKMKVYKYKRYRISMETEQEIIDRLNRVERKGIEIEEHMVNVDSILTEEDYEDLLNYRKEKAVGKLISHEQLKKELMI